MRKVICCIAIISLPTAAIAVPFKAGSGPVSLPGTTAAAEPGLAGVVVKDDLIPFTLKSELNGPVVGHGQVQVRVVKDKAGDLSFHWRIINATDSKPIVRFEVRGDPYGTFVTHDYDVNWRKDGLGTIAPVSFAFTSGPFSPSTQGNSYFFDFIKNPVMPGTSSRFFFIKTNATKIGKARVAPGAFSTWSAEFEAAGPLF